MESGGNAEDFTHFGKWTVGSHDDVGGNADRLPLNVRFHANDRVSPFEDVGKGRAVPHAAGILFFQRLKDGAVDGVGDGHQGSIIGGRQLIIVNRTQPLPADLPKMNMPDGTHGLFRQVVQQPDVIQNFLPVRLNDFPAYALGRTSGPFKHQRPKAPLGQQETQDGPAASGADHDDVNVGVHTIGRKRKDLLIFKDLLKMFIGFFPSRGVGAFQPLFQK